MAATPFHFGDGERTLYGVYHEPAKRIARASAVLLLNPFGEEAIRAFRMYKVLAEALSAANLPVLRFDYYGTGDSAGDCAEAGFAGMCADAAVALDELADLAKARHLAMVGLGLGGAVALRAGRESKRSFRDVVLWDPVASGTDYLAGLREAHVSYLAFALARPAESVRSELTRSGEIKGEAMGFALSPTLFGELDDLDIARMDWPAIETVHLVSSQTGPDRNALIGALEAKNPNLAPIDSGGFAWNCDEALNAYTVPRGVIDAIVRSLGLGQ